MNHVGYMDEAIANGATRGFELLADAWLSACWEIADTIMPAVAERAEQE